MIHEPCQRKERIFKVILVAGMMLITNDSLTWVKYHTSISKAVCNIHYYTTKVWNRPPQKLDSGQRTTPFSNGLSCCRKSSYKYLLFKMKDRTQWYNCSSRLTIEMAERGKKNTFEQQNIRCNRNRFLFKCTIMPITSWNQQTRCFSKASQNSNVSRGLELLEMAHRISAEQSDKSLLIIFQSNH